MKHLNLCLIFLMLSPIVTYPQMRDSLESDPVNITAMAVIQKYIYAIGGMEKFKSVKDRTTVMTGYAMNQPINIMIMQKYPDKLFQELSVGDVSQLIYYHDGKGILKIGNEITEIENKELERLKIDATMQLLIDPEKYGIKTELLQNEMVDSVDCYKIKFTLPSGLRWFQYYDVATSLKFKETKEVQTNQGLFEQETYFSDYRSVDGLEYPFRIKQYLGLQEIDLTVTNIEINSGLDENIFKMPD
jgi:zinc protease